MDRATLVLVAALFALLVLGMMTYTFMERQQQATVVSASALS